MRIKHDYDTYYDNLLIIVTTIGGALSELTFPMKCKIPLYLKVSPRNNLIMFGSDICGLALK
jgi:hypothetical protein